MSSIVRDLFALYGRPCNATKERAFYRHMYQKLSRCISGTAPHAVHRAPSYRQSGGRVSMPGEYFGMEPLLERGTPTGTVMDVVTDAWARPSLESTFRVGAGLQDGGGSGSGTDALKRRLFEKQLREYRERHTSQRLRLAADRKAHMFREYNMCVDAYFRDR